jgi:hypothetical protein
LIDGIEQHNGRLKQMFDASRSIACGRSRSGAAARRTLERLHPTALGRPDLAGRKRWKINMIDATNDSISHLEPAGIAWRALGYH